MFSMLFKMYFRKESAQNEIKAGLEDSFSDARKSLFQNITLSSILNPPGPNSHHLLHHHHLQSWKHLPQNHCHHQWNYHHNHNHSLRHHHHHLQRLQISLVCFEYESICELIRLILLNGVRRRGKKIMNEPELLLEDIHYKSLLKM